MSIISFITTHWVEICAGLSALHILAKLIVAWTPTPKDNLALEKIVNTLKTIISVVGLQPPVSKILENNTPKKD